MHIIFLKRPTRAIDKAINNFVVFDRAKPPHKNVILLIDCIITLVSDCLEMGFEYDESFFLLIAERVLDETIEKRRNKLNYTWYTVSEEHRQRMKTWFALHPGIFPIPEIGLPREQWYKHKNYNKQPQMPKFHVHFREEMFLVLRHVNKACSFLPSTSYSSISPIPSSLSPITAQQVPRVITVPVKERERVGTKSAAAEDADDLLLSLLFNIRRQINTASTVFTSSMTSLAWHIRMEENILFPRLQTALNDLDEESWLRLDTGTSVSTDIGVDTEVGISCLYADHEALNSLEMQVAAAMESTKSVVGSCENDRTKELGRIRETETEIEKEIPFPPSLVSSLNALCCQVLTLDTTLLRHLGEEEEIVVPLGLALNVSFD